MSTLKGAKTMAKSLRGALADRNVLLSHSDCLEIVARQFGFADWNTLLAKLPIARGVPSQDLDTGLRVGATNTSGPVRDPTPVKTLGDATHSEMAGTSQASTTVAPWTKCSFCGKSRPEIRILLGGCGGWEGFRARGLELSRMVQSEGLERSNVFICDECVALAAKFYADHAARIPPAAGAT